MTDGELDAMCKRVVTWDQVELDRLLGQPAIKFAEDHERDVRRLASAMWDAFPLGSRWWKIRHALKNVFAKNAAIKARAEQIKQDRTSGKIVERHGRLVYANREGVA